MKLKIITPDATLFNGNVASINIAEKTGSFSILNDHAPLITVAKNFVTTLQTETDGLVYIAANSGTFKMLNNEASLLIDYGVLASSKEEAQTALKNLKKEIAINSGRVGDDTIADMEFELMRRIKEMRN